MKRFISILLTIMIVVSIFSNSINLVHAEKTYSVSYRVGPYSFNTDTQGNLFHTIDGTKYYCSDDYEDTAIDKIVSLENKNVVFELHDNKIAKMYTMDEVLVPQIKVETDVKDGIYYQNGKFSKSSFNLVVKLSNHLSSKFQEVDLLNKITSTEKSRIYNYLTKLEIEPSGNDVDFGSSGWWVWKEYTTNISETMNQKITVNETKEYSYAVNLQYVLNMPSYNITLYVTPTFDNTKYNRVINKVKIGNLDYQEEKTEEKKKTSNTGKTVAQASNELSNMQSIVSFTKNYLSSNQKTQINEFVNLWVSELIFAKYVDKSDIKEKVSEKVANKVLDKLGVDTSVMLIPGTINATTYLETESTDGKKVFIEFDIKLMDFDFGNSGMPTMATGSGTATLYDMDGNKLDSSPMIIAYSDLCAFCNQLQKVAKDTIFDASKIHLGLIGISAESTAEALSSKMMTTLLNNNYTKKVFKHVDAKDVKKALEKLTVTGAKKCNNQIFKLVTTPKKSSTLVSVDCPVDVTVYDNDGNICAVIKDDEVDSAYEDIFVNVVDSRKNIYLIGDDYSFEITGTDTGTMDYTVTEFDEDGNKTTKIDYNDVQLTNGCKYYSYVPDATNEHQSLFYLTNDKNEVVTLEGTCGSNIIWSLSEDGTLNINGSGKMSDYHYKISASSYYHIYSPWYNFRNNIKKVVISDGVTSIGGGAFEDCTNLTSITIPDSVTSIGDYAFEKCTSLSNISIPDGITNIGHGAFSGCSSLIDATIPNSVVSIKSWAFSSCSNLKSIVIPDSVTNIGEYVFYNCINLNDILIPNGVVSIGNYAFNNCISLSNITIPNSVITIGEYAFSRCTNLKDIVIPDSVADIGKYAFSECTNLTSIKMPANITIIKHDTFSYCNNLINVNIPNKVSCIESFAFRYCRKIECIEIPSSVEQIGEEAFAWCNNLSKVIIGSGIKRIEKNAFYKSGQYTSIKNITDVYYSGTLEDWCKIEFENEHSNPAYENFYINNQLITNITISSNIKEISAYTFNGFECLQKVTISNGVSSVGTGAFQWCGRLTSLSIPASVTSIENTAFCDCTKLSTVYYSGTSEQWNQIQIGNNNNELLYATIHCTDKTLASINSISLNKSNLTLSVGRSETLNAIITPEDAPNKTIEWTSSNPNVATVSNGLVSAKSVGTATITAKASNGLTAVCTVTVTNVSWTLDNGTLTINGNGIIEDNSFAARSDIKKVVIQNGITGIGEYAFYNCKNIESVIIGNNVKEIGYRAFLQCDNLKSVTIGNSVKKIGESAFYNCPALSSISIPDSVTDIGNYAFYHCLNLKTISVSNNIERIGKEVFYNTAFYNDDSNWVNNALYLNNYLVHVKDSISGNYLIKNGTICIADKVFSGYSNLTEVTIPDSVLYMGNWTFSDCTNLRIVTTGKSVRSIGYDTFSGCVNLENITIPSSVKSIGDFAFFDCYKLSKIIIPNSVTEIGENAFSNCSNLSSVTIGNGITEIKKQTFDGCTGLKTINFGNKLEYIGERAFKSCSNLKSVSIPNTVTVLGESAFENCIRLENITIGNNVKLIGNYAFWNSEGLSSVTIGTGVTDIGDGAFGGCPEIKDVYYDSYESQWNSIVIGDENEDLLNANIHFKTLEQVDVTGITLNKKSTSLIVGQSENLTATVLPSNATDANITWTSSNSRIVTVNNGKITGINVGTAKITAKTSNNISATCFVTVSPTSNMKEIVGDVNFDGVVNIIDATEVQRHLAKFIEFSDIQKNLADTNGDSSLNIIDATEIQRYLAKYIDHFKQPSSISLNTNSITLVVGNTQTLSANILPNDATNKTVSWFSSNNSIATVTYGVVTAKAPGTAIITAKTYNGKTTECTITVKPVEPSSISLNKNSLSLYEGDTYQLSATISPSNVADKNLTWSSNNNSVISVDSNGKVTAKSIGSATVTVKTSNEKTAKCNITVSKQYIEIYTEDDLYNINDNLGGKYILMNDIAVSLPSIGCTTSPFTGVFDGNGHTITIDYNQEYIWSYNFYSGIFGYTKGAEIKNLNVEGTLVLSLIASKSTCSNYCGGIAAYAIDTNFSNCNNNATIISSVGTDKTVSCSAYAYSAGIVGWCSGGYLVDCTNTGEIKAFSNMNLRSDALSGGIVAMGSATDLKNCVNTGRVYAEADTNSSNYWAVAYAGGMIAHNNMGELNNCKNYGKIVSKCLPSVSTTYDSIAAAGGLVGRGDTYYSYCTSVDLGIIATGNSFSTVYFSKWIAIE